MMLRVHLPGLSFSSETFCVIASTSTALRAFHSGGICHCAEGVLPDEAISLPAGGLLRYARSDTLLVPLFRG
jgi:hypothetical protein